MLVVWCNQIKIACYTAEADTIDSINQTFSQELERRNFYLKMWNFLRLLYLVIISPAHLDLNSDIWEGASLAAVSAMHFIFSLVIYSK